MNCGCPTNQVVHPTQENVVHQCSEETVQHIHPSHTTVVNHHLIKNQHVYPHSTSVQNTVNSVDEFGGAFNVPAAPGQVAGAFDPGLGAGVPGYGMGPGAAPGQVAGAFDPGAVAGAGTGLGGWGGTPTQVAGAMDPGLGYGAPSAGLGAQQWKKPKKWC